MIITTDVKKSKTFHLKFVPGSGSLVTLFCKVEGGGVLYPGNDGWNLGSFSETLDGKLKFTPCRYLPSADFVVDGAGTLV